MWRFRLLGIPFGVQTQFWIGSAILGSNTAQGEHGFVLLAIWVACVFVSIVVHELGHALMARRFGVSPVVVLQMMGGLTYLPGNTLTRPQSILVTLAGPAAGFALLEIVKYGGGALLAQTPDRGYISVFAFEFLLFINFYWTVFNLLPILPLDGGQFVRNLLGPRHLVAVQVLGGTFASLAGVYFGVHQQIYLALFLGLLAFSNFRGAFSQSRLAPPSQ